MDVCSDIVCQVSIQTTRMAASVSGCWIRKASNKLRRCCPRHDDSDFSPHEQQESAMESSNCSLRQSCWLKRPRMDPDSQTCTESSSWLISEGCARLTACPLEFNVRESEYSRLAYSLVYVHGSSLLDGDHHRQHFQFQKEPLPSKILLIDSPPRILGSQQPTRFYLTEP